MRPGPMLFPPPAAHSTYRKEHVPFLAPRRPAPAISGGVARAAQPHALASGCRGTALQIRSQPANKHRVPPRVPPTTNSMASPHTASSMASHRQQQRTQHRTAPKAPASLIGSAGVSRLACEGSAPGAAPPHRSPPLLARTAAPWAPPSTACSAPSAHACASSAYARPSPRHLVAAQPNHSARVDATAPRLDTSP